MHSVQFAVSYPDFMDGIFPIVGGALMRQRRASSSCPDGFDYRVLRRLERRQLRRESQACAANALSVLISYFYTRDWWEQYIDTPEAYTKWRNNWGDYYLDVQDARDLYYLADGGRSRLGRRHPGLQRRPERGVGLNQSEDPVPVQPSRPILSAAAHRGSGQGDSECTRGVDRFGRRSPDLLQRRPAGHTGHGRGDKSVPARAECASARRHSDDPSRRHMQMDPFTEA